MEGKIRSYFIFNNIILVILYFVNSMMLDARYVNLKEGSSFLTQGWERELMAIIFSMFILNFLMYYKKKFTAILILAGIKVVTALFILVKLLQNGLSLIAAIICILPIFIIFFEIKIVKEYKDIYFKKVSGYDSSTENIFVFSVIVHIAAIILQFMILIDIDDYLYSLNFQFKKITCILLISFLISMLILIISFKFKENNNIVLIFLVINFLINLFLYCVDIFIWNDLLKTARKFPRMTIVSLLLLIFSELLLIISLKKQNKQNF